MKDNSTAQLVERLRACRAKCAAGPAYDWVHPDFDVALLEETIATIEALTRPQPSTSSVEAVARDGRFWILLHEPGCTPERKGPFSGGMVKVIREFIEARPTAYIDAMTLDSLGQPTVAHGPEMLQMLDGRSMSTGRKHNARTREAHAPHHAALAAALPSPEREPLREALEVIAGGHISNGTTMVLEGRWRDFAAALQKVARAALAPPTAQSGDRT